MGVATLAETAKADHVANRPELRPTAADAADHGGLLAEQGGSRPYGFSIKVSARKPSLAGQEGLPTLSIDKGLGPLTATRPLSPGLDAHIELGYAELSPVGKLLDPLLHRRFT